MATGNIQKESLFFEHCSFVGLTSTPKITAIAFSRVNQHFWRLCAIILRYPVTWISRASSAPSHPLSAFSRPWSASFRGAFKDQPWCQGTSRHHIHPQFGVRGCLLHLLVRNLQFVLRSKVSSKASQCFRKANCGSSESDHPQLTIPALQMFDHFRLTQ